MTTPCDVVIFAHKEASVIERTVRSVLLQSWTQPGDLGRVIVVSTASTDGTDDVVEAIALEDPRVTLLAIPQKTGKARDVSLAVDMTVAPVLVLMDADVAISEGCLPRLVKALEDRGVGMAVPFREALNPRVGIMNLIGHLVAELQNVTRPKAGQVLALRREYGRIDPAVSIDDAYQEFAVLAAGLRLARIEEAVVRSMAPQRVRDYIAQRRRVTAQCLALEAHTGYRPATRGVVSLVRLLRRVPLLREMRHWGLMPVAFALELVARVLGRWDYHALGRDYATWSAIPSAKPDGS